VSKPAPGNSSAKEMKALQLGSNSRNDRNLTVTVTSKLTPSEESLS
jgi:hypothetical protein